jgi:cytochrome c-type biogenesis protein CcmH/NrfG
MLKKLVANDAANITALIELGSLQRQLGNLKEARATLRQALQIDETDERAILELKRTLQSSEEKP